MKALDDLKNCFDESGIFGKAGAIGVNYMRDTVNPLIHAIEKELKERYVELPLDKDGVPIHVGDEMMDKEKVRFVVSELNFTGTFVHVFAILGGIGYIYKPSEIRHYNGTIEEALREFAIACEDAGNAGDAVNRLISEYAERLQLKEES